MDFLTLDFKGVLLALLFIVVFLLLGQGLWAYFVLAMLLFLVLSALVTYIGYKYKTDSGLGQAPRGIKNVLANGIPPIIMVALFYIFSKAGNVSWALLSVIGFLASVASITSDKFGSEIGVLHPEDPRMLITWKKVKKGTSGGVTGLGTFMSLVGAFLVALLIFLMAPALSSAFTTSIYTFTIAKGLICVTAGGFVGGIVDSLLGYFEEKGIGNKYSSNFVCGIVGGLFAMLLFIII